MNREALDEQEAEIKKKYEHVDPVPRPPHWGGWRLKPIKIEFWQEGKSRLHDRIEYLRKDPTYSWTWRRLQP